MGITHQAGDSVCKPSWKGLLLCSVLWERTLT